MGDIFQPRIIVYKPILIVPTPEQKANGCNWSVRIDRAEGNKIHLGLHWGKKIEPTHLYELDASKWWAAIDQLRKR